MWLRIVSARRTGVDLGLHRVADGHPAVQRAAVDGQACGLRAGDPLDVLDVEQHEPSAARRTPVSATWPPLSA